MSELRAGYLNGGRWEVPVVIVLEVCAFGVAALAVVVRRSSNARFRRRRRTITKLTAGIAPSHTRITLAPARRVVPAPSFANPSFENVVSLDAYRAAHLGRGPKAPVGSADFGS